MRDQFAALLLMASLAGCTVTARSAETDTGPSNTCKVESDCGKGTCREGVCQTLNGQVESLLLEVTPTGDSLLPSIPFLKHVEDVPTSGGERAISLARSARVTGHLKPHDKPGCTRLYYGSEDNQLSPATDGLSLPVRVTLTPRDGLLGVPTQIYLADATLPTISLKGAVEYTFELQVPAATYDVYIEPVRHSVESTDGTNADECRIPPQLFRRELIANDTVLDYPASVSASLALKVLFPQEPGGLNGWVVDIIEPLSGNPISTEGVLAAPSLVPGPNRMGTWFEYTVSLAHSAVVERGQAEMAVESANDLVRLRPPAGLVAPTLFLDRGGLGLFAQEADKATVSGFTKFPSAVIVEGQMVERDGGAPSSGSVELVSTEIFGVDDGIFASFHKSVPVDDRGFFSVSMPPGKYRVYGVPPLLTDASQQGLSAAEVVWDVPADAPFQAGRLLELPPRTEVSGRTVMPSAEIQAVASPQTILPFEQAFGAAAFVPRATPGLVDTAGRFVVEADPGRFDISVRAPQSSGFGWYVRPGFQVQPESPRQDLGRLDLPQPSLMLGRVTVGQGVDAPFVPFALVRAYAYLDENRAYTGDASAARSVVQVAQTRTDEGGAFRLLVPANIDAK